MRPALWKITKINAVHVENTEFSDHIGAKPVRIDLLVTDCNKTKYILEIQLYVDKYMLNRNLIYTARILSRQLESGEDYSKVTPVVMINITDYLLFDEKDAPSFYNVGNLILKGTDYVFSDDLSFFFVELPKFRKQKRSISPTALELWLDYFLEYKDEKKRRELAEMSAAIQAFDKAYNQLLMDDETWIQYELERRSIEAYHTGIRTAIEEAEPAIIAEMAKNLLKLKLDKETICKSTGLDLETIEKLENE